MSFVCHLFFARLWDVCKGGNKFSLGKSRKWKTYSLDCKLECTVRSTSAFDGWKVQIKMNGIKSFMSFCWAGLLCNWSWTFIERWFCKWVFVSARRINKRKWTRSDSKFKQICISKSHTLTRPSLSKKMRNKRLLFWAWKLKYGANWSEHKGQEQFCTTMYDDDQFGWGKVQKFR
jgi:hypothetical protein